MAGDEMTGGAEKASLGGQWPSELLDQMAFEETMQFH